MIGFFPEPYPDELLFSIVSRYAELTDYQAVERLNTELFSSKRLQLPVAIPANLAALVAKLPPGHHFSVERLINDHTLLPLFAPFISQHRYQMVRRDMETNRAAQAYGRLGINNFKAVLKFFRYCPQCVTDDRKKYKEAYWHRLHHIPNIDVCSVHGLYLKDSPVGVRSVNRPAVFVTAEEALKGADLNSHIEENDHLQGILRELATNASWLLEHPTSTGYRHGFRNYYIYLFYLRGLCTYSGTVKRKRLVSDLTAFYSSDLLERLQCQIHSTIYAEWPVKLAHRKECAMHPIHHLLMLQFLGTSAREFVENSRPKSAVIRLESFGRSKPFGSAPWPCLNATAEHFKENVITSCELAFAQRYPRKPRGTFRCSCGFAYSRLGPDTSRDDRYKLDRYVSFGELWYKAVREMIAMGWSIKKIARALKISPRTITLQLRLLESSEANQELTLSKREDRRKLPRYDVEKMREFHRGEYGQIRAAYPQYSRSRIAKQYSRTYSWLNAHDKDWLRANLPPKVSSSDRQRRQSKWLARDAELSEAVGVEAARLRALPGRPEMISETAIASNLGFLHVWSKRRRLLPQTSGMLHEVAETWQQFAVRRIEWVAGCLAEQGISAAVSRILQLAGISWESSKTPTIRAAIDQAVADLKSQMEGDSSNANVA